MPAAKSPEFRRRALDLVEQGEPVVQVARNLGISESCLRRWMSQAAVDAGHREGLTTVWFPPNRGGLLYAASRSGATVFS